MKEAIYIPNRINWIDWAKVISISFVVFGHIPQVPGSFPQFYIVTFHMPLFFFISGYLTKKEYPNIDTLKKYWKTLIIPYIIYNIIFYPYWIVRYIAETQSITIFDFVKPLIGTLLLQLETPISESLNGVTWFISALLIMKLLIAFSNNFKRGYIFIVLLAFICAILFIINEHHHYILDMLSIGFMRCFPFYIIGYFFKNKNIIPAKPFKKDFFYFIVGLSISLLFYKYFRHTTSILDYALYFWVMCISSIIWVIAFCRLLNGVHSNIIENISIGTIVIMGIHWILIGGINFAVSKALHINGSITYTLGTASLITIAIEAVLYPLIILFMNRYTFMLGKRQQVIK